jgi:hypothetical protein
VCSICDDDVYVLFKCGGSLCVVFNDGESNCCLCLVLLLSSLYVFGKILNNDEDLFRVVVTVVVLGEDIPK